MEARPPVRVFQVATGNVGREMVRRIGQHPDLELIGLHCYTPEKVGRDAGEIVGLEPVGVIATGRVEDILAARPDCVYFNGVFPDMDLFETVLGAGINVVSTADWITGHHRDAHHPHPSGKPATQVIREACERGASSFYGTGTNPGLAQIVAMVSSAGMARVDHVTVKETVDVSCHHSVGTWTNIGYGRPVHDPELPGLLETGNSVFGDSIDLIADGLGAEVERIDFEVELGACTEDVDLGWWTLTEGSLGASLMKFKGIVGGGPRIEVHLEWQMTPKTEPHWDVENCYVMTLLGDPVIVNRHMIFPELDSGKGWDDPECFASIGMTITGLPGLNAMRHVVDAPPGLLTSADLPLRAFAGRLAARPLAG